MTKVLFVFGTRPEAIKLCPLIRRMSRRPDRFQVEVCITAQHREMLDQVLSVFDVEPDYDLDLMAPGQSLTGLTAKILTALEPVLRSGRPDLVLVQGDTCTTMGAALSAYYRRIPVAHVEAGLRTGDLNSPFPEELNRSVVTRIAALHFAATNSAARNLLREGVDRNRVHVTGNTGIDAVLDVAGRLAAGSLRSRPFPFLDQSIHPILVTAHRRESFGGGLDRICEALRQLSLRPDVQIVYPVHPNPSVQQSVSRELRGLPNVFLINPLDYVSFVDLMRRSHLVLTDSGGVQEEAPSLGKPVLVMREKTERLEAVQQGTAILVGTDPDSIRAAASELLDNPKKRESMTHGHNPFGDGRASRRISAVIDSFLAG